MFWGDNFGCPNGFICVSSDIISLYSNNEYSYKNDIVLIHGRDNKSVW